LGHYVSFVESFWLVFYCFGEFWVRMLMFCRVLGKNVNVL
jgi:hypothetical protein